MISVLSVASESVPLIKTGGLADVAGALPGALAENGVDMRVLLPAYTAVLEKVPGKPNSVWKTDDLFGHSAEIIEARIDGVRFYLLKAPQFYERQGGPYTDPNKQDWPDNAQRFAALSMAACRAASEGLGGWKPEILHLHDWQAALTALYVKQLPADKRPATVLTIHNIAFQGIFDPKMIATLDLPTNDFNQEGYEFWGNISFLKAGLVHADKLTTVSPTYAAELMTPEFGMGMEGVLQKRNSDLIGILNGIDENDWQPPFRTLRGKRKARSELLGECGLQESDGPLFVVVSRLSQQKGLDTLLEALPTIFSHGGRLALLGSGDDDLERGWANLADKQPEVSVRIGYDEAYSRRLIAGGDAVLIPSRFEPCGLTQLYGLRHGTLPVTSYTGGLVDTVISANPAALSQGVANGLHVHPNTADGWARGLEKVCHLFKNRKAWERMQKNAMSQESGWQHSAPHYKELYAKLLARA